MINALLGLLLAAFLTVVLTLAAAGIAHLLVKVGVIKDEDKSW